MTSRRPHKVGLPLLEMDESDGRSDILDLPVPVPRKRPSPMLPGLVEHVCRIADVDHDGSVDIDNVTGDDDEVLYRAQVAHVHGESDSRASSADTATTSQLILCKTHRRTTDKEQARRKLQHEYELLSLIHSSSVSSRDSISADTDNATSEITTMAIQHTPVVKPLRLAWHRPVQGAHGKSTVIAKSMPRPSGECDADTESDQVVLEMEDLASARTLEQLFLHSKSVGDRNLTDNRSNHRLSFAAFLSIALQLSHALDLIHDANIIHRGIQPRNILATPIADGPHSFRVKVANLGSAVYVDKRSRVPACANVRACDMPYLSPEETGRLVAKVNYRTDFYSLGVLLYELLSGTLPFDVQDPVEWIHCHLAKTPTPLSVRFPRIPHAISQIIMKLMQKTPEKRYQSAKGLTTDLLMLIHRILHPTVVVATSHGDAEDLEARMRAAIAGLGRLRTLKDDQIYDALRNFDLTLGIKDEPLYQVRPALHYIAREEEREDMGRVVREVLNGEQEACLIAVRGDVGAGMTRLVVEMGGQVRERGQGVFASGCFQSHTDGLIPLSGFRQVMVNLLLALHQSPDIFEMFKSRAEGELDRTSQVLLQLIVPELEQIFPKRERHAEAVVALKANNALVLRRAYIDAWHAFFNVLTEDTGLVLFLDDFQWADHASIALLAELLTGDNHQRMVVIIALKSSATMLEPPAVLDLLSAVRASQGRKLVEIQVRPFDEKSTRKLLMDMLEVNGDDPQLKEPLDELARYLVEVTTNVAHLSDVIEELVRHGLIRRQRSTVTKMVDESYDVLSHWSWDIDAIRASNVAKEPAMLNANRFDKLPDATKHVIALGAIIGSEFDLFLLANLASKSVLECALSLRSAHDAGVISCTGLGLRYLSQSRNGDMDKMDEFEDIARRTIVMIPSKTVQKRALASLSEKIVSETHHRLAQLFSKSLVSDKFQHGLFRIVRHYACALGDRTTSRADNSEQLVLTLHAAELAQTISCAQASIHYYQTAVHLLEQPDEAHWKSNYATVLHVYQSLARLHLSSGQALETKAFSDMIYKHGASICDKLSMQSAQISGLLSSGECEEAMRLVATHLNLLQCAMPADIHALDQQQLQLLEAFPFQELLVSIERDWLHQVKSEMQKGNPLLDTLAYALLVGRASGSTSVELWSALRIVEKVQEMDLFHPSMRDALLVLASRKIPKTDLIGLQEFHRIWNGLITKYPVADHEAQSRCAIMCHELGLIPASSQEADTELEKAVECGLCCGSTYIHGMAGMAFLTHRMKTGEPLADLFDWAKKFGRTFLHGSQCTFKPWAEIVHLLEWLTSHEPGASIALQNYRPALLSLRPSFGKLNWILALILDLPLSRTPTLTDPPLTIGFYGAYAAARECSRNSVQSAAVLERLDRIIMEVEVACKLKASRDVYKLYLLMAERHRIRGQDNEALELYEKALEIADDVDNHFFQAVVNEGLYRYWLERGATFLRYQRVALKAAQDAYLRFGASRKVELLERALKTIASRGKMSSLTVVPAPVRLSIVTGGDDNTPRISTSRRPSRRISFISAPSSPIQLESSNFGMSSSFASPKRTLASAPNTMLISPNNMDMFTILRATQTLSDEAPLEKMISDLMHHLAANVGADSGMLLLRNQDVGASAESYLLQARFSYKDDHEEMEVLQSKPVKLTDNSATTPNSLFAQVTKSQKSVLLNAPFHHDHASDLFLIEDRPFSIMCVPLLQKGRVLGVILLANHVLTNAFAADRLEVVRSVGMSAAMAFENARLTRVNADLETALQFVSGDDQIMGAVPKYTFDGPVQKAMDILSSLRKKYPAMEQDAKFVMGLLISGKSVFASSLESIRDQSGQGIDNDMKAWLRDTIMQPHSSAENIQLNKTVAVMSSEKRRSSSRRLSTVTMSHLTSHTDAVVNRQRLEALLDNIGSLDFDVFELYNVSGGQPITALGPHMVIHTAEKFADYFQMDHKKIRNFFSVIDLKYKENTYHNSKHGADVMQNIWAMLTSNPELFKHFTKMELLAAIISGCVHDVDHPGVNNNHLIETKAPLSTLYSDQSVLEYHHLATAFNVALADEENNIFSSFRPERYREIRKLIVNMVLSTDMAKHFEYINKFKARIEGGGLKLEDPAVRSIVLEVAIKCSDLNNPSRSTDMARKWTDAIMGEFYHQGDLERALGLPVSKFMDRHDPNVAKCQIGFIDFLVMPLFELWQKGLGDSEHNVARIRNIAANRKFWEVELNNDSTKKDESATTTTAVVVKSGSISGESRDVSLTVTAPGMSDARHEGGAAA